MVIEMVEKMGDEAEEEDEKKTKEKKKKMGDEGEEEDEKKTNEIKDGRKDG